MPPGPSTDHLVVLDCYILQTGIQLSDWSVKWYSKNNTAARPCDNGRILKEIHLIDQNIDGQNDG